MKLLYSLILLLVLNCTAIFCQAQITVDSVSVVSDSVRSDSISIPPRKAWNNVFIELAGSAILSSVNYEVMFSEAFALRAGIFPVPSNDLGAFTLSGSGIEWAGTP